MSKLTTILLLICGLSTTLLSQNTKWLVFPEYDTIGEFNNGVAIIEQNGKFGYIKLNGEVIVPCQYDKAYPFSEDIGVAVDMNNAIVALIHKNGNIITDFDQVLKIDSRYGEFSDELLLVTDGAISFNRSIGMNIQKWGYIDKNGKIKLDIKYFFALPFSEGLACVSPFLDFNYLYTYINTNGEFVIKSYLNNGKNALKAFSFNNGEAIILDKKGLARIDTQGKNIGRIIKFTPAENPYTFSNSSLLGAEGRILIDEKGRVTSFNIKNDEKIRFVSLEENHEIQTNSSFTYNNQLYSTNADWQSDDIAKVKLGNLYGLIQTIQEPIITTSMSTTKVQSVFGETPNISFNVAYYGDKPLQNVNISVNNNNVKLDELNNPGYKLLIDVEKTLDAAIDKIKVPYSITCQNLLLNKGEFDVEVIDQKSIDINLENSVFTVKENATHYSVGIIIENKSNFNLENADLYINDNKYNINIPAYSQITETYTEIIDKREINIEVKPNLAPSLFFSKTININIEPSTKGTSTQKTKYEKQDTSNIPGVRWNKQINK